MLSENWATLWEALAAAQPDHTAVVLGRHRIKWRDLDDRASRFASFLNEHGVGTGDRVAQMLYNCPEYLESAYAAFKIRASTVNVNYRYRAPEVTHVLSNSGATVLLFHEAFRDVVEEVLKQLPSIRLVVQVQERDIGDSASEPGLLGEGFTDYEEAIATSSRLAPQKRSGSDSLFLYTGGTTGMPKGVVWNHESLFGALAFTGYASLGIEVPTSVEAMADLAVSLNSEGRSPVNMTAPPLMHGTAMFLAFSTFVLGGTVVLLGGRRFDAKELLNLAQDESVTQLSIVGDAFARPIVEEMRSAAGHGSPYRLGGLSRVVSTGATLSWEMKQAIQDMQPHVTILDMIGASEGGPFAVAMSLPGSAGGTLGTATFMATPQTVLFDEHSWERIPFGSGRVGILGASGPMPEGYHQDQAATAATFRTIDGIRYAVPGDFAIIDADGRVQLLGRGSVCINTGGEKVYPEEVEVAARTIEGIIDCVAVGIADQRYGEIVSLVAERRDDSVSEDDVIAAIRSQLAPYKAPRRVVFVDQVYRSPSGKADYRWAQSVVTGANS